MRGRILSAEKSLVRASAAVERKQTWSHPLFFLVRPPQGPETHISPETEAASSCTHSKLRVRAALTPLWPGKRQPPSARLAPALQSCTGPPVLSDGKPAQSPVSTLHPGPITSTGKAASHLSKPRSFKQTTLSPTQDPPAAHTLSTLSSAGPWSTWAT